MAAPLANEIALRIGLAARLLPDSNARVLLQALIELMGEPITDAKLQKLRISRLQAACRARYAQMSIAAPDTDIMQQVFWLLKGRGVQTTVAPLPIIESGVYCELSGSVRVACCSSSGEEIDAAFSSCTRFLVYQVAPQYIRLIDIREPTTVARKADRDLHRVNLIRDCTVMYTTSIGAPSAAAAVRSGLHPVRLAERADARAVLERLQAVLMQQSKPPWLAKAMGELRHSTLRYGDMSG